MLVARAYPDRGDFLIPGKAVRDHEGHIIACDGFSTMAYSDRLPPVQVEVGDAVVYVEQQDSSIDAFPIRKVDDENLLER